MTSEEKHTCTCILGNDKDLEIVFKKQLVMILCLACELVIREYNMYNNSNRSHNVVIVLFSISEVMSGFLWVLLSWYTLKL
jgi:hypothetical protein